MWVEDGLYKVLYLYVDDEVGEVEEQAEDKYTTNENKKHE